jgi:hypothetical protein
VVEAAEIRFWPAGQLNPTALHFALVEQQFEMRASASLPSVPVCKIWPAPQVTAAHLVESVSQHVLWSEPPETLHAAVAQ